MISINEDINYRHSRTPSVCQYKHQYLVLFIYFFFQKTLTVRVCVLLWTGCDFVLYTELPLGQISTITGNMHIHDKVCAKPVMTLGTRKSSSSVGHARQ